MESAGKASDSLACWTLLFKEGDDAPRFLFRLVEDLEKVFRGRAFLVFDFFEMSRGDKGASMMGVVGLGEDVSEETVGCVVLEILLDLSFLCFFFFSEEDVFVALSMRRCGPSEVATFFFLLKDDFEDEEDFFAVFFSLRQVVPSKTSGLGIQAEVNEGERLSLATSGNEDAGPSSSSSTNNLFFSSNSVNVEGLLIAFARCLFFLLLEDFRGVDFAEEVGLLIIVGSVEEGETGADADIGAVVVLRYSSGCCCCSRAVWFPLDRGEISATRFIFFAIKHTHRCALENDIAATAIQM